MLKNNFNYFEIDGTMLMAYFGEDCDVVIPNGVTDIFFEVFSMNNKIKSVTIPASVTSLTPYVFEGCSNLEKIIIHSGLKEIGLGCFANCPSLTKIFVPKTLTHIQKHAFQNCRALQKIYFEGSKTEWSNIIKDKNWNAGVGEFEIIYNFEYK